MFIENQQKGGYKVYLDPGDYGGDMIIKFNLSYDADPEIAKWINTADFRRALSLGIDRDQINETFWLGTGTPSSVVPADNNKYNPGPQYRKLWATLDVKQANEMLDKIGLAKKDAEGYRLRTDGKGRLRIEIMTLGGQFLQFTQIAEMIREQWKKIGIDLDLQEVERSLALKRTAANEQQLGAWNNDGSEHLFTFPLPRVPLRARRRRFLGAALREWFHSGGTQGKEPPAADEGADGEVEEGVRGPREGAHPARQGGLEDRRRGSLHHRRDRPGPGLHGRARGQEQPGEHPVAPVQQPGRQDADDLPAGDVLLEEVDGGGVRLTAAAAAVSRARPHARVHRTSRRARALHGLGDLRPVLRHHPVAARATTSPRTSPRWPPPGSVVTEQEAENLRIQYGLGQPMYVQYLKWMRLIAQGNFGMSMEWRRPVTEVIGERLWLTVVVSVAALFLTWVLALPIGIYSAVRQYSLGDYAATFVGFIGLAVPNFLLALVLLYLGFVLFNAHIGGLFSPEYQDAPWSPAGLGPAQASARPGADPGAGRDRAADPDHARQPAGRAAQALRGDGARQGSLRRPGVIVKYPVRVALNPFASTIGYTLPYIVSGSIIVSLVLGLADGRPAAAEGPHRAGHVPGRARSCSCSGS